MAGYWIIDGKQMTDAEYQEHKRKELEAKERVQREAAALVKTLGQAYEALTSLMEQNPEVGRQVTDGTAADEEIYRKLRQNLERADKAPRCRWVRQDGTSCGSPHMRKHIYCYAHKQMMEARALALDLPAPEDANAIQISLTRVQTALIDDTISAKKAGLLLYSLQLAITNSARTTFGQAKDEDMVTDVVDEEEALEEIGRSGDRESGRSEERKTGLPRINADERGLEQDGMRSEDREIGIPQIHTDNTDRKNLPRNADERGSEQDGLRSGDRESGTSGDREIGLPQMNTDDTNLEKAAGRILPKPERDRSWEELPLAALEKDAVSGSFDAPSSRAGTQACSG
jgi:hypothetical protein